MFLYPDIIFLSQYHLLKPPSSNKICNITPVIKKAKLIPYGFVLSLFVLFIVKLKIIEPMTKQINPIIADSVSKIHIDFTEKK